jgi:myosin-5
LLTSWLCGVQALVFQTLAGILHLGDVVIADGGRDRHAHIDAGEGTPLARAAALLGVSVDALQRLLVSRRIATRSETFYTPCTREEAGALRDSLAKAVYLALFVWAVEMVNVGTACEPGGYASVIGILDIYGFECFETNSLEQLCINYANEHLQQQFVRKVFASEQALYEREEIAWSFVEYTDNRPCLDLIEGPHGVIMLLDEQCALRRAVRNVYSVSIQSNPIQ